MEPEVYLEVTYRRGKPLAAYLHLAPCEAEAARTRKAHKGLIVDYDAEGNPIGIEITAPSVVTAEDVNRLLTELHRETLAQEELAPLRAS